MIIMPRRGGPSSERSLTSTLAPLQHGTMITTCQRATEQRRTLSGALKKRREEALYIHDPTVTTLRPRRIYHYAHGHARARTRTRARPAVLLDLLE